MLAAVYRRFGEVDAAGTLYERVALALSESPEALRAIEAAPVRGRRPPVILAALYDLALAGGPRRSPRPTPPGTAMLPPTQRSTRCSD